MSEEAYELAARWRYKDHPDIPFSDWQKAVAHGATKESYWDYVLVTLRQEDELH